MTIEAAEKSRDPIDTAPRRVETSERIVPVPRDVTAHAVSLFAQVGGVDGFVRGQEHRFGCAERIQYCAGIHDPDSQCSANVIVAACRNGTRGWESGLIGDAGTYVTEGGTAAVDRWHQAVGQSCFIEDRSGPIEFRDVETERSRSERRICGFLARQTEGNVVGGVQPRCGSGECLGLVVSNPQKLTQPEDRLDRHATGLVDEVVAYLLLDPDGLSLAARVEPGNRVMRRMAVVVDGITCFTHTCDRDSGDARWFVDVRSRSGQYLDCRGPYLFGVVIRPSGFGVVRGCRAGRDGEDRAIWLCDDDFDVGRADVEAGNQRRRTHGRSEGVGRFGPDGLTGWLPI